MIIYKYKHSQFQEERKTKIPTAKQFRLVSMRKNDTATGEKMEGEDSLTMKL